MIKIVETSANKLKFKQYPANQWLAFIFLLLLGILVAYHILFQSPISSSLSCSKDFFNRTNCQLVESAFLNHNLTNKHINNIKEPRKTNGRRNNAIWLATDIKIWHGKIQNVYYPSSFSSDPFLYRTNRQVFMEIEKLNKFINGYGSDSLLTIQREVPKSFSILIWIYAIPFLLPAVWIILFPITTYSFDLKSNKITVLETILWSSKERQYPLESLTVISKIEQEESSIALIVKAKQEYILKDFGREKVLPKILELIKPFTTISANANQLLNSQVIIN